MLPSSLFLARVLDQCVFGLAMYTVGTVAADRVAISCLHIHVHMHVRVCETQRVYAAPTHIMMNEATYM